MGVSVLVSGTVSISGHIQSQVRPLGVCRSTATFRKVNLSPSRTPMRFGALTFEG